MTLTHADPETNRQTAPVGAGVAAGKWLAIAGGAAALLAGGLFVIAAVEIAVAMLLPGAMGGWSALLQNNWLILIFQLHAGFAGAQSSALYRLNLLDLALLALVGVTLLGLYAVLRRNGKIWSAIAAAMPFLGIVLFIVTQSAGRSAVMGAVLVISMVMLRSAMFKQFSSWTGLLAGALLLLGDVSLSMVNSPVIAALTAIGYISLIAWLFGVARRLFHFGHLPADQLLREG